MGVTAERSVDEPAVIANRRLPAGLSLDLMTLLCPNAKVWALSRPALVLAAIAADHFGANSGRTAVA